MCARSGFLSIANVSPTLASPPGSAQNGDCGLFRVLIMKMKQHRRSTLHTVYMGVKLHCKLTERHTIASWWKHRAVITLKLHSHTYITSIWIQLCYPATGAKKLALRLKHNLVACYLRHFEIRMPKHAKRFLETSMVSISVKYWWWTDKRQITPIKCNEKLMERGMLW